MKFDKKTTLIFGLSGLCILCIGVWLGRASVSPAPAQSSEADRLQQPRHAQLARAGDSSRNVEANSMLLSLAKHGGGVGDGSHNPHDLVESMDLDQVRTSAEMLAQLDATPSQVAALEAVLERWAQLDPLEAMAFASGVQAPKRRHDAKLSVLRGWGGSDPASALDYLKDNPHETDMAEARAAVFDGLGKGDIGVALNFLESDNKPNSKYASEAYYVVQELFLRSDREVIDWVGNLTQGPLRDRAIWSLMDEWARYDPESARIWLESQDGEAHKHEARVELGESWARVDPQAALGWASGIDADPRTTKSIRERIFTRWLQYDLQSAAEYLVSQDPAPELDHAFELYISRARHYDPEATMVWAESITDPGKRVRAMKQVASVWKNRDREAFDAYLHNSGLSEGEVNSLQ